VQQQTSREPIAMDPKMASVIESLILGGLEMFAAAAKNGRNLSCG